MRIGLVDSPGRARGARAIWLAPGDGLSFTSRKRFHYLAVREDKLYLVEEELE